MDLAHTILAACREDPFLVFVGAVAVSLVAGVNIGLSGFGDPGRKFLRGFFSGLAIVVLLLITGAVLRIWVLVI